MHIKKFRDMYLTELQLLRSAEMQLGMSLRHMAEAAMNARLADALMRHCRDAEAQGTRLDLLLRRQGSAPRHSDKAMRALIAEAQRMALLLSGSVLRDAGLIAGAQKLDHYAIAAYGTAAALAGTLDLRDDCKLLHRGLDEKKRADAELTQLVAGINREAAAAEDVTEAEEEAKAEEGKSKAEVEKA